MPLELIEDALGDERNAVALALASDLSYLPESEARAAFSEKLGLDVKLVSVDNTQAYIATNDKHIVVAFRGTESPTTIDGLKDWLLTDAVNLLILPEGPLGPDFASAGVAARYHQGFVGAITEIWEPVLEAIQAERKKEDRPIWITGHSLGGALAQLSAWLLLRKTISVHQVYTFGAPMVGNADVSAAFGREFPDQIYRYVNYPDPVPRLPTLSLLANDYLHCAKEMPLGAALGDSANFFTGLLGTAWDGLLSGKMLDQLWKAITEKIGAHSMTEYVKLLGKK